jgi:hypothetical protein
VFLVIARPNGGSPRCALRYLDVLQPNHLDLDDRASSNLFAGLPFDVVLNR